MDVESYPCKRVSIAQLNFQEIRSCRWVAFDFRGVVIPTKTQRLHDYNYNYKGC